MINEEVVLEVLRDIVEENPDTVARCLYSEEGGAWRARAGSWAWENRAFVEDYENIVEEKPLPETPVCIVGQVVHRLNGVDGLAAIVEGETITSRTNAERMRGLGYTPEAISILSDAQRVQDEGGTWWMALDRVTEDRA